MKTFFALHEKQSKIVEKFTERNGEYAEGKQNHLRNWFSEHLQRRRCGRLSQQAARSRFVRDGRGLIHWIANRHFQLSVFATNFRKFSLHFVFDLRTMEYLRLIELMFIQCANEKRLNEPEFNASKFETIDQRARE